MLTVAQKMFSGSGSRSGRSAALYPPSLQTMIPFILPSDWKPIQPMRCGRGMIVPNITGKANTSILVTHNLGRFVQGMWPLLNSNGDAFTPKLMFDNTKTGTRTQQQQSIIADVDLNKCIIVFF
jgi:hypothetical protein